MEIQTVIEKEEISDCVENKVGAPPRSAFRSLLLSTSITFYKFACKQ